MVIINIIKYPYLSSIDIYVDNTELISEVCYPRNMHIGIDVQ